MITASLDQNEVLSIGIFDITASRSLLKEHGPNGDLRTLDEIISWVIPEPGQLESTGSTFCLHPSSGMVYQQSPSALAIYDFSTLVPRVFNFMPWGRNDVTSCLRLSPTLMAATSSTSLTILDSNYCSMQAECPLKEPEKVSRKGATDSAGNSITRLLSYFAPLDLLIALQGRRLIAIQLSTQTLKQFGSRKRARDGLLINSIGRGVVKTDQTALISSSPVKEPAFSLPKFESDSSWKKQRILLDQHARNGSLLEFESLMAQELKIELKENHEDVELVLEDETPHQPRQPSVDDWLKIRYLLSKIFSIDTGQGTTSEGIDGFDGFDSRLKIVFFPPRLFSWLAAKGYLSSDQVETSLKHHGSLPLTGSLATGTLFQALIKYDLSLQTLLSVLASPIYIGSGDLIQALGLSLGLLKYSEPSGHMKLITDNKISDKRSSSETPDGKSKPINAELDGRVLVDSKFGNGEVIQAVFRSIITKLHAFHGSEVTKTLKAVLSKSELLSLVDLLRMELAQNGWLSHYLDSESGPLRIEHQDNNQASMVAKLLNSVIDSLGTAGWILGAPRASDLTETADTISYMRAEISAALEGVEEATYLKGLLGELLLYGETVGPTTTKSLESASASLWTKPITVGREGGQNNYLPLGLKAPQEVSLTKVGAGGELQRRSMRDIGRLKSRMVGKYSFERIVI
ncbi:hypothetical protein MMC12_004642 [Toensbergia leucococca]|nr:hypothetical protein [Toensbergia leucococca]